MPFVGRDRWPELAAAAAIAERPGRAIDRAPDRAGLPPTRPWPSAWPRRVAAPRRIGTTGSGAPRVPTGCSGDRRPPRPGGRRHPHGPCPDPIAPTTCCSACGSTSTSPGLVDGYFGPADAQGPGRHGAAPLAGAAARGRRRPARADRRARSPSRTGATGSTPSSSPCETQAAVLAGDESRTSSTSSAASASSPVRRDEADFDAARGRHRRAAARRRAADRPARGVGRAARRSRSTGCPPSSTGWSRASARGPRDDFGLPAGEDLRVWLVTGQPWTGYNWYDGGRRSRVDLNTDLPIRARRPRSTRRPRDVSGPPPRARLEGGRPRRAAAAGSRRRSCSSTRPSA